jgi:uncharacterized protein YecT (DUF1311 family)
LLLTPKLARALGIEIFEQVGAKVVTPMEAPVVDVYVDRFVAFSFMGGVCDVYFQPARSVIESEAEAAHNEGTRMVGDEHWVKLMTQWLDVRTGEIREKGALLSCLETEAELRAQHLSTGLDGPSFGCSAASLQTERAICADKSLWAKDRAMNAIYLYIRKYNNDEVRKDLLAAQRQWLAFRNNCGLNTKCLHEAYDHRLRIFHQLDMRS